MKLGKGFQARETGYRHTGAWADMVSPHSMFYPASLSGRHGFREVDLGNVKINAYVYILKEVIKHFV